MKPKREGPRVMMRLAPTVEGLLTWASQQDEVTQAMVLGIYPAEGDTTAAERAMKEMAKGR
jgi:hypothetical protein